MSSFHREPSSDCQDPPAVLSAGGLRRQVVRLQPQLRRWPNSGHVLAQALWRETTHDVLRTSLFLSFVSLPSRSSATNITLKLTLKQTVSSAISLSPNWTCKTGTGLLVMSCQLTTISSPVSCLHTLVCLWVSGFVCVLCPSSVTTCGCYVSTVLADFLTDFLADFFHRHCFLK